MQFVVPIPFWLYAIFLLFVFTISVYVFYIVLILWFIYFLFTAPKETVGLIFLGLIFKYWQIAIPLIIVIALITHFSKTKPEDPSNQKVLTHTDPENSHNIQEQSHE